MHQWRTPRARGVAFAKGVATLAFLVSLACTRRSPSPEASGQPAATAPRALASLPPPPAPVQQPVRGEDLGLPHEGQQTPRWCWAAATRVALRAIEGDAAPSQEDIVAATWQRIGTASHCRTQLGAMDCLTDLPKSDAFQCIQSGWPPFTELGYSCRVTGAAPGATRAAPLEWDVLTQELSRPPNGAGRPIVFAWKLNGGGGHVLTMTGFLEWGDQRLLIVQDPWPPCRGDTYLVPMKSYVGGPDYNHEHWYSWWGIEKSASPASVPSPPMPQQVVASTGPVALPVVGGSIPAGAGDEAQRTLVTCSSLLTDATWKAIGLGSAAEAQRAQLGPPFEKVIVHLDDLAAFKPGDDVAKLLEEHGGYLYPALVDGKVRFGIETDLVGGAWTTTWVGGSNWTQVLSMVHGEGEISMPGGRAATFLIVVPALRAYYIGGREQDGRIVLAEIQPGPTSAMLGFVSDAATVFTALSARARAFSGLPT